MKLSPIIVGIAGIAFTSGLVACKSDDGKTKELVDQYCNQIKNVEILFTGYTGAAKSSLGLSRRPDALAAPAPGECPRKAEHCAEVGSALRAGDTFLQGFNSMYPVTARATDIADHLDPMILPNIVTVVHACNQGDDKPGLELVTRAEAQVHTEVAKQLEKLQRSRELTRLYSNELTRSAISDREASCARSARTRSSSSMMARSA